MGFLRHISVRYISYVILSHTSLNTQLNSQLLSQGDTDFPATCAVQVVLTPPPPPNPIQDWPPPSVPVQSLPLKSLPRSRFHPPFWL